MSGNTVVIEMSVTDADLSTLLRAWHFTRDYDMPRQITDEPTIALDGVNYRVRLPRVHPDRATEVLKMFDRTRVSANEVVA